MSDLRRAVAAVFRRQGAGEVAKADFRNVVSFDLRWFGPKDARRLLERALAAGFLEECGDGERVRPTFDVDGVDVPVPYKPTGAVLEEPAGGAGAAAGIVEEVAAAVARAEGVETVRARRALDHEAKRLGGLVAPEVAALLVARKRGVDVGPWLGPARAAVRALGDGEDGEEEEG